MSNIQLPSGLVDENTEVFSHNGEPMALHNGQAKKLFELPLTILRILNEDLKNNESAETALTLAGYTNEAERLKKYCVCRFGSIDASPDIVNGKLGKSEHYDCGFRGSCAMEGIVCGELFVNGHVLTPFEVRMIKSLSTEELLPVVAETLQVSMTTFEIRKKLLFEKLKVQTRSGMVSAAYKLGILNAAPCIN